MKNNVVLFGTKEWAIKNVNFMKGCSNNCKYCYARAMAARFKRIAPNDWKNEKVDYSQLIKKFKKVDGYIMCPSSHDLTPGNIEYAITIIRNILQSGNKVLLVTKPNYDVIHSLCNTFETYKENILFRFTIGSTDNNTLKFWESGAPTYDERKASLIYAYKQGFKTSISCEPMLDNNVYALINELSPYVNNKIWIGKVNKFRFNLRLNEETEIVTNQKAEQLIAWQSDENIVKLYNNLCTNPIIEWKESIKKVIQKRQPKSKVEVSPLK